LALPCLVLPGITCLGSDRVEAVVLYLLECLSSFLSCQTETYFNVKTTTNLKFLFVVRARANWKPTQPLFVQTCWQNSAPLRRTKRRVHTQIRYIVAGAVGARYTTLIYQRYLVHEKRGASRAEAWLYNRTGNAIINSHQEYLPPECDIIPHRLG